jgi:TRAP-type C4-dicarboxylate transport system permease small subunit
MQPIDPYQKAAQLLLRLVAAGAMLVGGMMVALEFLAHRARQTEMPSLKVAAFALLLLAGVMLFAVSRNLAARLTGEDDDEADDDSPTE